MSFLSENKILFGAVGIALSSAVAGLVIGRVFGRTRDHRLSKLQFEQGAVSKYVAEYGIREPLPLAKLRQVRIIAWTNLLQRATRQGFCFAK